MGEDLQIHRHQGARPGSRRYDGRGLIVHAVELVVVTVMRVMITPTRAGQSYQNDCRQVRCRVKPTAGVITPQRPPAPNATTRAAVPAFVPMGIEAEAGETAPDIDAVIIS